MPTVIDSFVIQIGLDPKNFNANQRAVLEQFKRTQEEGKRRGTEIEETTNKINSAVSLMRTNLLGAFALFAGGRGIKEFAQYIVSTTAELGRFAERTDNSTEHISKWVNAARLAGVATGEMTSFMGGLIKQYTQFAQTGADSGFVANIRAIGIKAEDARGKLKPFDTLLKELNEKLSKMSKPDAAGWIARLGGSDSVATFMSKSVGEMDKLLARAAELGLTLKPAADAAREIESAFTGATIALEALGQKMMSETGPAFTETFGLATAGIVLVRDNLRLVLNLMQLAANPGQFVSGIVNRNIRRWLTGGETQAAPTGVTSLLPPETGGLRMKPGESTAGASIGLLALAASLQGDIPGLQRFTGMNDRPGGKHGQGLALDFTIADQARSAEVAAQIRAKLASMGVGGFVKDEYKEKSPGWTGPHIHVQFNSAEDARRYSQVAAGLRGGEGSVSNRSSQVNIGTLNVVTQATDATGISNEISGAIDNVYQAQTGQD